MNLLGNKKLYDRNGKKNINKLEMYYCLPWYSLDYSGLNDNLNVSTSTFYTSFVF